MRYNSCGPSSSSLEDVLVRELLFNRQPQPSRRSRSRRRKNILDDFKDLDELKKFLKESDKKDEKKDEKKPPTGVEKFQQFCAHWGYLTVVGIPVGFATLGVYHLLIMTVSIAIGMK